MGKPLSMEHFYDPTILVLILEEITDPAKPEIQSIPSVSSLECKQEGDVLLYRHPSFHQQPQKYMELSAPQAIPI
jgi:hypothetical protein